MKKTSPIIWPVILCLSVLTSCGSAASDNQIQSSGPVIYTTSNNLSSKDYVTAAENDALLLEINEDTTDMRVTVKQTGYVWSTEAKQEGDTNRYPIFSVSYRDMRGSVGYFESRADSVDKGQYKIEYTKKGVRVLYTLGTVVKAFIFPTALTPQRYLHFYNLCDDDQKLVMDMVYRRINFDEYDEQTVKELQSEYPQAVDGEIYGLRNKAMNDALKLEIAVVFESLGYTEADMKIDGLKLVDRKNDSPVFNIAVEYSLEGDQLLVRVPFRDIISPPSVYIETLNLLECFKGSENSDGYFLLPDGSGSVMNYQNGKLSAGNYGVEIYGQDKMLSRKNEILDYFGARLNLYGCREGDNAYLAVIEDSDSYAYVNATTGSDILTPRVWPGFYISVLDYMTSLSVYQTDSDLKMAVHPASRYQGDILLRYAFLTGDSANYSGMAKWYRNYLFGDKPPKNASGYPLTAEMVGLIKTRKDILGFACQAKNVLTGFEQAGNIAYEIKQSGADILNLKLSGWFNGGYRHGMITGAIKPEKALGGDKALSALGEGLKNKNIGFYPDAEVQYAYAAGGSLSSKYTARMLNQKQGLLYRYDLAVFEQTAKPDRYVLRPSVVKSGFDALLKDSDRRGFTSLSLRSVGSDLNSDYNPASLVHRQENIQNIKQMLQKAREKGISLMLSKGNAYTLPYADMITDLPLRSDRYSMTDYSVPFMAMVLSGNVGYTSGPVNLSNGGKADLLRMVENGASPYYVLTAESTVGLDAGDYDNLYATEYSAQKKGLLESYQWLKAAVGDLYGQTFLSHKRLAGNVYRSEFSGGWVIVNYNSFDVTVDGIKIEGCGYQKGKGVVS